LSLKSILRPRSLADDIARLEARVNAAAAELAEAQRAYGDAIGNTDPEAPSAPAAVSKARQRVVDAREDLDALRVALERARERQAEAERAEAEARAKREQAERAAIRKAAFDRAAKACVAFEQALAAFAAAARETVEAERALAPYFNDDFPQVFANALMALPLIVGKGLQEFVPSFRSGASLMFDDSRAKWAAHAPSLVLKGCEKP